MKLLADLLSVNEIFVKHNFGKEVESDIIFPVVTNSAMKYTELMFETIFLSFKENLKEDFNKDFFIKEFEDIFDQFKENALSNLKSKE